MIIDGMIIVTHQSIDAADTTLQLAIGNTSLLRWLTPLDKQRLIEWLIGKNEFSDHKTVFCFQLNVKRDRLMRTFASVGSELHKVCDLLLGYSLHIWQWDTCKVQPHYSLPSSTLLPLPPPLTPSSTSRWVTKPCHQGSFASYLRELVIYLSCLVSLVWLPFTFFIPFERKPGQSNVWRDLQPC